MLPASLQQPGVLQHLMLPFLILAPANGRHWAPWIAQYVPWPFLTGNFMPAETLPAT